MEIVNQYGISAVDYLRRARSFLKDSECLSEELYYCALEMRCCIERLLYEYIWLIGSGDVCKNVEPIYNPKSLKKHILSLEPLFIDKIKFLNVVLYVSGSRDRFPIPKMSNLCTIYGKLGAFLHAPRIKTARHTEQKGLEELLHDIHEADSLLTKILKRKRAHIALNSYGQMYFRLFHSGIFRKFVVVENMKRNSRIAC